MTFGATMLMGRSDPLALFDAMAVDLLARAMVTPDGVAAARARVPGSMPATALLQSGALPADVLRALATATGIKPAPPRSAWLVETRRQLRINETVWVRLLAVPIGVSAGRPHIAFADASAITSSAALGLPAHVPCVALEHDVRDALAQPLVVVSHGAVSFLAPPSAVAQGMSVAAAPAFGAGTQPALAGTHHEAAAPSSGPLPPLVAQRLPSVPSFDASPSFIEAPPGNAPPAGDSTMTLDAPRASVVPTFPGRMVELANDTAQRMQRAIAELHDVPGAEVPERERVNIDFAPGAQCGRYVLEKKIGEGGMATVFVANPIDGQGGQVAIKVVRAHLLRAENGTELRRRFQREVGAMKKLQHRNIVACVESGHVGDTEYLATELVTGGSLSRILVRTGKLAPMLALSFFGDLLAGLAHAHDKGIVHRDLKPDNLLVDADGNLKVADFGIARLAEGTKITTTGGMIGTPSYMSPEQALMNPVDARTDLYSAGVILYELIAGRNPFAGEGVIATLANVMAGNPRSLGEVEPATPLVVDLVVARLLSLRPDDRFPSAAAVLAVLAPVLDRAQLFRSDWKAVVNQDANAQVNARAREAEQHASRARVELRAGERMRAALAAFRATCLIPELREAKSVLGALNAQTPVRFARSSTPALMAREMDVLALHGDARRAEYRALAQLYLDEENPLFAAHYARRAVAEVGASDEADVALLTRVLPNDELDDARELPLRRPAIDATSAKTAWRPTAVVATPVAPPAVSAEGAQAARLARPDAAAGLPSYLKLAIVIASTAIPIGVLALALRGCS